VNVLKYFFKSISISLVIIFSLGASVGLTKTPLISKKCSKFTYLENQDYALCAGAESWIFNGVTYAKCTIENGTSASLPLNYPAISSSTPPTKAGNIENVNQEGIANKTYIVSTYTPPTGATTTRGGLALYTCNSNSNKHISGSYAQCDGGICFKNTSGTSFPGVGEIASNEILCSCPITTTNASYQVYGPSVCPTTQKDYDAICGQGKQANKNGKILMIGAPTNTSSTLAQCLGQTVSFNTCKRPSH
jgi:hypothetical protein